MSSTADPDAGRPSSRKTIAAIRENDVVREVYRLEDKQLRPNKNGTLYLQFTLCDKTGSLAARYWNVPDDIAHTVRDGDYVAIEGAVQRFQGALQLIAKRLTTIDPTTLDLTEFVRTIAVNITALQQRLRELLLSIQHPHLLTLANCFLIDETFQASFAATPAATKIHHAYPGGLLEHTVTMMEEAARITPLYPYLCADLVLIGAFLHDIGKIEELPPSGNNYTDAGQLLGHAVLGLERLQRMIAAAEELAGEPFDPELAILLKHCIASHHGTHENQAIKLPMFPEAMLIHCLDTIDSKLTEFQRHILEDTGAEGGWTPFVPALDRKIYKRTLAGCVR